jgi:hypothetical protein
LGKLVLRSARIGLAITGVVADILGFPNVSKKIVHQADLLSPCEESSVLSRALVQTVNSPKEVDLNRKFTGICAGSSIYFNYLYSRLREEESDQKDLLIKCANLFVEGGNEAAVRLHSVFGSNFIQENGLLRNGGASLLRLVPDDVRSSLKEGQIFYRNQEDLRKLSNGAYIVRLYNSCGYHAISLVKILDEECYIFDPEYGLFEFKGVDFPGQVVEHLNNAYRHTHKYHYLRWKRQVQDATIIKPSDLKEFYLQILPIFNREKPPEFPLENIPNNLGSFMTREVGFFEYTSGVLINSCRVSMNS